MRLTTKITLLQTGFAAVVLLATLLPLVVSERRHVRELEEKRQAAQVEQLARACGEAFKSQDEAAALGYLKTLVLVSPPGSISYGAFLDAEGRTWLHTEFLHGGRASKGKRAADPRVDAALASPEGGRSGNLIWAPVYFTGPAGRERRGTAVIAYDPAAASQALGALQRDSLSRVAQVALPGLGLGLLLAFVLGRALAEPIQRLAFGTRRVGEGRLDTRIPDEGSDELGDLARDFNAMAAKLNELDELKDSFLAQITHDLRNPLTAIIAHVNVLGMGIHGPVNEKQKKNLDLVQESSLYLNELIGDILDLTKLEAGKMEFAPKPVDAHAAARAVLDLNSARAAEYGVALECAVPEGASVTADPEGLKRVLINLVSNALKFTPKGGKVTVGLASVNGSDRISVSDTGIGIPEDKLGLLFRKFSQVAETKNKVREAAGTGLGLVICKQIVEAHGGTIGVESVYRKGTTFFFHLPKAPRPEDPAVPSLKDG
ncbi:MAG: HAMP domain-containing histidine kinase [Elusimicrobia bacterium]|nr:HAMP domain-containing histidine kinase [Elusimicrobiota bacterium]